MKPAIAPITDEEYITRRTWNDKILKTQEIDVNWPRPLSEWTDWLDSIPEEIRADTMISFEMHYYDEFPTPTAILYHRRYENREDCQLRLDVEKKRISREEAKRLKKAKLTKAQLEEKERKMLARLKKKYEGK